MNSNAPDAAAASPQDPTTTAAAIADDLRPAWWLLLTLGIITMITGILVLAWPGATLLVLAVLFGFWLIMAGVLRLVAALAEKSLSMGWRVVHILIGVLLVGAGIGALANLFSSLGALVFLAGFLLILDGADDLVRAVRNDAQTSRGWLVVTGVLGVIAGGVVLSRPAVGLFTLVVVLGAMLLMLGVTRIAAALSLRQLLKAV